MFQLALDVAKVSMDVFGGSVHRQYYCEQPVFIHILPILSASTFLIPITLFTPGQTHEAQLVYKQPQAALLPATQLTLFKTIPILVRLLAISLQLQHPISFKVSLEEPTRWFSGTASYWFSIWLFIRLFTAMINFGTVNLQLQSALTLFQSEAHFMSSETAIGIGDTITETVYSSCIFPCTS